MIEVPGKLSKRGVVMSRLIPSNELGPPDYCLFPIAQKRAIKIAVPAKRIELLFRPACRSPDQAIVLDSILAFIECGHLDHCESASLCIKLASETILLQNGLQWKKEFDDCR